MKKFNKISIVTALTIVFAFAGPVAALAVTTATTPDLGDAASFGILSSTYTNDGSTTTTINGDVGYTVAGAPTSPPTIVGGSAYTPATTPPNDLKFSQAGIAQAAALTALGAEDNATCDVTFPVGDIVLDTASPYTPGVYCITGAMSVGVGITLNGDGTYIFRSTGALNTVAGSIVTLTGASACDVFWQPNGAVTINAGSTFFGTVIPTAQDITIYGSPATSWTGRALTFGHTVTTPTANVSITVPTCAAAIDGVCGTAATTPANHAIYAYTGSTSVFSTAAQLCSAGTSPATQALAAAGGSSVTWTCAGQNTGENASCTATRAASATLLWLKVSSVALEHTQISH